MSGPLYGYYINLDERGEFCADVRNAAGESLWEFNTQEVQELIRDGFIKNIRDPNEVGEHLIGIGILPADGQLLSSAEFEQRQTVFESLARDHYVTVKATPLVEQAQLHIFDRSEYSFITGPHKFIINDLERLIEDFEPRDPDAMQGKSPIDRVRHMLEETSLDQFHEIVPIMMLEDFEIVAEPSPKAVADGVRYLLANVREASPADDSTPGL